jgi:polyisoprenoid-binding protein YceI
VFNEDIPTDKDGTYNIIVKGNLTLHNITKPIEVPATIELKQGSLSGKTSFKIKPEDYNISIPSIVRDKIAGEMMVIVNLNCSAIK